MQTFLLKIEDSPLKNRSKHISFWEIYSKLFFIHVERYLNSFGEPFIMFPEQSQNLKSLLINVPVYRELLTGILAQYSYICYEIFIVVWSNYLSLRPNRLNGNCNKGQRRSQWLTRSSCKLVFLFIKSNPNRKKRHLYGFGFHICYEWQIVRFCQVKKLKTYFSIIVRFLWLVSVSIDRFLVNISLLWRYLSINHNICVLEDDTNPTLWYPGDFNWITTYLEVGWRPSDNLNSEYDPSPHQGGAQVRMEYFEFI